MYQIRITLAGWIMGMIISNYLWADDPTSSVFQTIAYQPEQIVTLQGTTFIATQIVFDPSEVILSIDGGDSSAWQIKVHPKLPYLFYLKPDQADSQTNLIVVTDQRRYYFNVSSVKNDSNITPTYAVRFVYPPSNEPNASSSHGVTDPLPLKQTHHQSYTYHGSPALAPHQAFDDGQFTYLRFSAHQPIPAIFAVTRPSGEEAMVNFRREDDLLILHDVVPQWTLRYADGQTISVFNHRLIPKRFKRGRRS